MYYLDLLDDLGRNIRQGQKAWAPTPCGWLLLGSLEDESFPDWYTPEASSLDQRTIFVNSLQMFKSVVPDLHPRIETLLSMHRKPLSLVFEDKEVVQMAYDSYLVDLIRHVGAPIVGYRYEENGQEYLDLEVLPKEVIENAAYVSAHRPEHRFELPVLANYNHKAVLHFIRE